MPTLLVVEASPRGEYSISRNLTVMFVEQWKAAHPGGGVVERDLAKMDLPYVNLPWLGASLTPLEKHTPEMQEVLQVRTSSSPSCWLRITLQSARRSTTTTSPPI